MPNFSWMTLLRGARQFVVQEVLRRSGHDDLLGTGGDVGAGLFVREEEAGGLDDDVGADFVPLEGGRILLGREADRLAVDDEVRAVYLDVVIEDAVHGIVLQHVSEVVGIEQVIDAHDLDVVREVLNSRAENHAADAAEAVDANLDSHFLCYSFGLAARDLPSRKIGKKFIIIRAARQGVGFAGWRNRESGA